jgi:protein-S-isoprenylcysteine O-methyltransferase Ste14
MKDSSVISTAAHKPAAWLVPILFGGAALAVGAGALSAVAHALAHPGTRPALEAVYQVLRTVVAVAFTVFTIGRAPAHKRSFDPLAFIACAVAMGGILAFSLSPSAASEGLVIAGEAVAVVACAALSVAVFNLGRCFGVLPEARGLVRSGAYAHVRHPLYAAETTAFVGLAIASPLLRNWLVLALVFGGQLVRMRLEERTLTEAFPEYESYAREVPRLIPSPRRTCAQAVALAAGFTRARPRLPHSATCSSVPSSET